MIRLTIDMPRWVWWLALRFRMAIALEVEGEPLVPYDLVKHGRPLTLLYSGQQVSPAVETAAVVASRVG